MSYKKILTIQDISCVGQCSLTVALPILSACGVETCILPSAVLSTHTAGFNGFTFRDLTEDMPKIKEHWQREGILFDAIYTGYLGSEKQIEYVKSIITSLEKEEALTVIDPAMADNGKLYPSFDKSFVQSMKSLCFEYGDVLLPNITEACMMTDTEYKEVYDEEYIDSLIFKMKEQGAKTIVLTGVGYDTKTTGVIVFENGEKKYYSHNRIDRVCHGTGDVFASAFVGARMHGEDNYNAAKIAADFTVSCIEKTTDDKSHWYGVKFEIALPELMDSLNN